MENAKIRIKMGEVEVECEGSEAFLKKELPGILETVAKLGTSGPPDVRQGQSRSQKQGGGTRGKAHASTSTIAEKLGGKTCGKLAMAAAVKLTVTDGADTFSREQMLAEMKTATAYYKITYRKNLTSYLKRLVQSGKLNHAGGDTYSLSSDARAAAEKALAQP